VNWLNAFQITLGALGLLMLVFIFGALVLLIFKKGKGGPKEARVELKRLNEKYEDQKERLLHTTLPDVDFKIWQKSETEKHKLDASKEKTENKKKKSLKEPLDLSKQKAKTFVIDFVGDIAASRVDALREMISAILQIANATDEVVVRLESPGGMVHSYGLASSQLERLKAKGIPLTVCVDKIAASGGYMMACIANQICAAPFAILGSIGVVASFPNFNRVLKKFDVDYLELTAGEYKRTLSTMGEVTEKGRAKFVEQLEDTHLLFKEFVGRNRPKLDLEKAATGEHWFGLRAADLGLVDTISTSDDYLLTKMTSTDVYLVEMERKEKLKEKIAQMMSWAYAHSSRWA
jgi:serine protease SohB